MPTEFCLPAARSPNPNHINCSSALTHLDGGQHGAPVRLATAAAALAAQRVGHLVAAHAVVPAGSVKDTCEQ